MFSSMIMITDTSSTKYSPAVPGSQIHSNHQFPRFSASHIKVEHKFPVFPRSAENARECLVQLLSFWVHFIQDQFISIFIKNPTPLLHRADTLHEDVLRLSTRTCWIVCSTTRRVYLLRWSLMGRPVEEPPPIQPHTPDPSIVWGW